MADIARRRRSSPRLVSVCAGLAMVPDLDLLVPGAHRMATHSVTAAAITFIVAAAVTGKVTRLRAARFGGQAPGPGERFAEQVRWHTATMCGLAYATHLLLDWLGADNFPPRGIQLLWPWSDRWFISDLDLFRQTARRHFLTAPILHQNLIAVAQELAILAPIVWALWLVRVKTVPRLAPEVAGGNHPAQ